MKKISTLLLAAASVALSANAADLTPVEVTIANPSFEETNQTANWVGIPDGWDAYGSQWEAGLSAFQIHNGNATNGNILLRTATAADVEEESPIYLSQTLTSQPLGTYVLCYEGQFTRSGWVNDISSVEGAHGFAFICDDNGDPAGTDIEDSEGISYVYGDHMGSGEGNGWVWFHRIYVVHTTSVDPDFGEAQIMFGFGVPATSATVSKVQIAADNVHLYYFDTFDTAAVNEWVNTQISDLKEGKFSNPSEEDGSLTPMAIVNARGNKVLNGVLTNSGYVDDNSGISDIAAPVVKDNKYYNLQGIEIAKPTTAGLYIHNGKKYIVK